MLKGLQALRFFAALAVLIYHSFYYGVAFGAMQSNFITEHTQYLSFGVMLFFALSGFLMAKLCEEQRALPFLVHRLLRIYPPFWVAVGLTAITYTYALNSKPQFDLRTLSLFPLGPTQYPLAVEWSLVYELFFYLVTAGCILLPTSRMQRLAVCAWAISIFLTNYFGNWLGCAMSI